MSIATDQDNYAGINQPAPFRASNIGKSFEQVYAEGKAAALQIPGVPAGMKLVRVGSPRTGEYFINTGGVITLSGFDGHHCKGAAILAFDNVYNCALESVAIPEGYERDGETAGEWFRAVRPGEAYINCYTGGVLTKDTHPAGPDPRRIILRKIEPKTKEVLVIEMENPSAAMKAAWLEINAIETKTSLYPTFTARSARLETRPV